MEKTRCKMVLDRIEKREDCTDVAMSAVVYNEHDDYDPPEENKEFFAFTPAGNFFATVKNNVFDGAKPGDEFYLDVIPIKK